MKSKQKPKRRKTPTAKPKPLPGAPTRPLLYRYYDGERERSADASALFRKMVYCDDVPLMDPTTWDRLADRDEPITSLVVAKIAELMNLKRFDGDKGMTDEQVLDVFNGFVGLLGVEGNAQSPGLILPQRFLLLWKAYLDKLTQGDTGSESCSTATASTADGSSPSPTASAQPSEPPSAESGSTPSTAESEQSWNTSDTPSNEQPRDDQTQFQTSSAEDHN